jgi:hypothetical protein
MRYETVQGLSDEDFRRSTGVQRSTFDTMLKTVKEILRDFGRPPKLSRADQLLLTLMYWREYRTEFHIGLAYGISESTVLGVTQLKSEIQLLQHVEFQRHKSPVEQNQRVVNPMYVGRLKRLKTRSCNRNNFTYQTRRHFNPAVWHLKLFSSMRLSSQLNALKKTAASVQRQKEMSYPESAGNCGYEDRKNSLC